MTSTELIFPEAKRLSKATALYLSVISISEEDRIPQVRGTSRTFAVEVSDNEEVMEGARSHAAGILEAAWALYSAAMVSQEGVGLVVVLILAYLIVIRGARSNSLDFESSESSE